MLTLVAWFEIVVGVGIAGIWLVLLTTEQVPEVAAGDRAIWFHLTAELLTAALLVTAGVLLLSAGGTTVELYAAIALGALLYTTINSAGHYADLGQWPVVGMFVGLAVAAIAAGVALLVA